MSRESRYKLRYLTWAVRAACYSLLLVNGTAVQAGPSGGNVTGGAGNIHQNGLNTTISQTSQNMAIDWQTFNVNVNERVQYIQPNSSSLSLNRVLSNTGSTIAGRIDANGQVILVNPNGVLFTPTAQLNVGGIIASGLDISAADFMNGDYIFNEVLGTEGAVINSGTINASLGGNVALLGRSVENNGLISATLGSVNLAAGKQAVLTFDNTGLLGVRVSQAILQNELGVDAAVVNSGDINVAGGRVLLTGSVSQDIFSQAVNSADMQARSVVVNADGTFTLGAGADVVNSGCISTSTTATNQNAGQIVLLGDNVTSSGELHADAINANAGEIELHAGDKTLLTQNSVTSAMAETAGQGGLVKVLGDKVGLFDHATVDVSGANGGGQALIGGDYQGNNTLMRNASRTTVAPDATIYADATNTGDGGKIIVWANEYTRYYGNIFARGGVLSGNGGFAEVSGKEGLEFVGIVDLSSTFGSRGLLLLDPKNITISTGATTSGTNFPGDFNQFTDISSTVTTLNNTTLANQLTGFDVILSANNDITVAADVTSAKVTSSLDLTNDLDHSLTLQAGRSIILNSNVNIELTNANFSATINATGADAANRDAGPAVFTMGAGSSIVTSAVSASASNSGSITINTGGFNAVGATVGDITLATLNSSVTGTPSIISNGGNISVTNTSGNIILNGTILSGGEGWTGTASATGGASGNIGLTATNGDITVNSTGSINANGGNAHSGDNNGGKGGDITLAAVNINIAGDITANGGAGTGNGNGGNGGAVTATVDSALTLAANVSSIRGVRNTASDGAIIFNGDATDNIFNINNNISLTGASVTFNGLGGNDQLVRGGASVTNSTWTVFDFDAAGTLADGINDGTLAFGANIGSNALRFTNIESLVGSTAVDSFTVGIGGSFTGLIDGGASFTSTDTLAINTNNITVQLGNRTIAAAVADPNLNVTGIETITAFYNTVSGNVFLGDNIASTWTLDGVNTGIVAPASGATFENTTRFSYFGVLTGGDAVDAFTVNASFNGGINGGASGDIITIASAGNVSGVIDGGTGSDQLNISYAGDRTVQISSTVTAANLTVNNIENINASGTTGNTSGNTLTASNASNTWTMDGTPSLAYSGNTVDFTGFTTLIGGTGVDTFNITQNFSGNINGGDNNDIFNIDAVNLILASLAGGNDDDTFNINATGSNIASLAGGAGSDTLRGSNFDSAWLINNPDAGTLDSNIIFSQIENLTGGTGVDTFTFNSTGRLSGLMNGGGNSDRLNLSALSAASTVNVFDAIPAQPNNLAGTLAIYQVEAVTANSAVSNTLQGPSINNDWYIEPVNNFATNGMTTGTNSGRLVFGTTTLTFVDFNHLVGGNQTNNFYFAASGAITGTNSLVDGGLGANTLYSRTGVNNVWTYTSATSGSLRQAPPFPSTYVNSFANIQNFVTGGGTEWADFSGFNGALNLNVASFSGFTGVIGNQNSASTLTGVNGSNIWEIYNLADIPTASTANAGNLNGIGDGVINRGSSQFLFIDFANLTGGNQSDSFIISNGGSIPGLIDGGAGADSFTFTDSGNKKVQLGTVASAGQDYLVNNIETINASNGAAGNQLRGANATNTWSIGPSINTVFDGTTSTVFSNFASLLGGSGTDNFNVSGTVSGVIDGGAGSDTLTVSAAGNQIVQLGTVSTTGANYLVNNIETINASNGATGNELRSTNAANTWNLGTSPTNNNRISDGTLSTVFTNFANLLGGTGNDTFTVASGFTFNSINTGNGTNSVTVNSGGTVTGAITGGNAVDTIIVNGSAGSINTQGDADNITVSGMVSGLIDGGSGLGIGLSNADTLTITAAGNQVVQLGTVNTTGTNYLVNNIETINASNGASGNELRAITDTGNNWTVSTNNSGNINGMAFGNFANLTGGGLTDIYTLNANVSGLIDGGDGSDILVLNISNTIVEITGDGRTTPNLNVYRIESIINSDASNALMGDVTDNTWTLGSTNTFGITNAVPDVTFTGFKRLLGNTGVDTFNLNAAIGDLAIYGGNGNDIFNINADTNKVILYGENGSDQFNLALSEYSSLSLYGGDSSTDTDNNDSLGNTTLGANLTLGTQPSVGGVTSNGIESIAGNYGQLTAEAGLDINWIINGINSGTAQWIVGGKNYAVNFTGFSTLNGSNPNTGGAGGNDSFIINGAGQITSNGVTGASAVINGRSGNDTLTVNFTGTPFGEATFDGGAGTNTITINGATPYASVVYTPFAINSYDQLAYFATGGSYNVNYLNANAVTNSAAATTMQVNGTSGIDTITLDRANMGNGIMNNFTLGGHTTVEFEASNLTVNAGLDNDVIALNRVNLGTVGTVTLDAETVTYLNAVNAPVVTAQSLNFENVASFISNGSPLTTDIGNLSLVNSTGDLALTNTGSLRIAQLMNTGALNVTANGAITSGSLVSGSALTLTALNGGITINDAANTMTGLLTLDATGNINIFNNSTTALSTIKAQGLSINSVGSIIGVGDIIAIGVTTLASGADISLNAANNNFNQVTVTSANNVTLNDVDALTLVTVNATGTVTVASNGLDLGSVSGAAVSLNAGSGAITDNNGAANNVTATSVTLRAATGIGAIDAIETSTALLDVINSTSGNVNINNTGAVTLTNLVNQSTMLNDSNITFINDTDITLDHVAADYQTGDITLNITNSNGSYYGIVPRVDSNGNAISFTSVPDIRGNTAQISGNRNFGTFSRPIVMDVRTQIDLFIPTVYQPFLYGNPIFNTLFALQASLLGSINTITGQQLIELESLADIDPAIFTAVRTYNYEDISIRMPSDQLYDDDEEEKTR